MKALTYQKKHDRFQIQTLAIPVPNEHQVLVKVRACGLNPVDTKIVHWQSLVSNMGDDFVVGLDVVGEIIETGDQVKDWKVGDNVLFHGNMFSQYGGLAEYCLQDSRTLTTLPDVPVEVAAATPCAGWTAWRALVDKLKVQQRQSVFISGGAGGVGGFAIQIAKYFGLNTIITTCSEKNSDYVKQLGATHAINYQNENVVDEIMKITANEGVNIALDCVGAESERFCADALEFEGEMVELVETANLTQYHQAKARGLTVHQLSFGAGYANGPKGRDSILKAGLSFSELLSQGALNVPQIKTIALDQAGEALIEMRKQRTVGKIVVVFPEPN
ncbi:zinc-binding dehydrogenase [Vibrio hangzhouensis]|uniref:NADPH:quinone reductase n=1 Tax=Vibrio hangzhouensis TaxID=462991 RepID=A0A1H5ZQB3_9VIBR|nr:zinc-binding dehydrogenase [Vibrio hangzhouensis]SEG37925.1 NADPH:quinone reductase [Vibrio hangzhouensis]